ncbi:MAG: ATP-dependent DNA ligase, partial [Mycobacteriales bacterium]
LEELAPYRLDDLAGHPWAGGDPTRIPGGEPSRWNAKKDMSWQPLRPELVVEVAYDHMEGPRFRHTAQFRRWRPDRDPRTCTCAQLERPVAYDLSGMLG